MEKKESKPLPTLVDAQLSVEKLRIALQIRSTHLKNQDRSDKETEDLLEVIKEVEKYVDKRVGKLIKEHPAYHWFSQIKGIGPENIGKVVGLVDIERAPHVSSLWKYAGMHVEDGKAPKRIPGKKLEYNSKLRTMCWRLAGCLIRANGKFYVYYLSEKEQYEHRYSLSNGYKIVPANKLPIVKGKKTEGEYKGINYISEGHIHLMSMRKMIKMFLSSLWVVWREAEGLPVSQPYVQEKLGHTHIRTPEEWIDKPAKKKKGKEI